MKYDLHSHTIASDGKLSAQELIDRAIERNIDVLAITDHDTVAAIKDAQYYLCFLDNIDDVQLPQTGTFSTSKLHLVSGIEISTLWNNREIHIVGLNIDPSNDNLLELIKFQKTKRDERATLISRKLNELGISFDISEFIGNKSVTRAHLAKKIIELGYAKDNKQAFKKYLGKGGKAYIKPNWCSMQNAIDVIHAAGGEAVLAHPTRYDLSKKKLRELAFEFKNLNGDAIEIAFSQQPQNERQNLATLAKENELKTSQGSDFHYPTTWLDLGKNLWQPKDGNPIWEKWSLKKQEI